MFYTKTRHQSLIKKSFLLSFATLSLHLLLVTSQEIPENPVRRRRVSSSTLEEGENTAINGNNGISGASPSTILSGPVAMLNRFMPPAIGQTIQGVNDQLRGFVRGLFNVFMNNFNRRYATPQEEEMRFDIFLNNYLRYIQPASILTRNPIGVQLGITQFSDLTQDEFQEQYSNDYKTDHLKEVDVPVVERYKSTRVAPDEVDWRNKGGVTSVKDQGECGACWAFAAAGAIEGAHFRKTGNLVDLSEQNLLDCTGDGECSCDGGHYVFAYRYAMKQGGIAVEDEYPYELFKKSCRLVKNKVGKIRGYQKLKYANEEELKKIVAFQGPTTIGIDSRGWQFVKGDGILYDREFCASPDSEANHAVLLVGYGTDHGEDYWLIKNSWGTKWGDEGFVKIARNRENHCKVASDAVYPII